MSWSLEDYCASQQLSLNLEALPESSRDFIARLGLPSLHPYYNTNYASLIHEISSPVQLPPQGPLLAASMEDLHNHSRWQATITWFYQTVPPFLAFVELWLRLFAGYLAPLLVLYLLCYCQQHKDRQLDTSFSFNKQRERRDDRPLRSFRVAVQEVLCLLALASSTILMTDSL